MFLSQFRSHISLLFLLSSPLLLATPRKTLDLLNPDNSMPIGSSGSIDLHDLERITYTKRGQHAIIGISKLKEYFHRFGYLPSLYGSRNNFNDTFDAEVESAILRYQKKLGLPVTRNLDPDTLDQLFAPPYGVPNSVTGHNMSRSTEHFVYFSQKPRWSRRNPMVLTYAFSPNNFIHYLKISDIRNTFERAFSRWASVVPISFKEAEDYGFADIRIGFYTGDHGDAEPFDGVLGILAHSFSPESGKLHLDASERWAVDFDSEHSKVAVDLESVAMHEIGHVLGLAHSSVKEAIMYPSLTARERRVELKIDDVKGIQTLYGSKHDLGYGSLLASETLSNEGYRFVVDVPYKWRAALISLVVLNSLSFVA